MANDNNIKHFRAIDIERYHKGLLSPYEMHALEKAALDDPFLADALEGYGAVQTNINADIAELEKRLMQKTGETKVVPLYAAGKKPFPWLRVAVLVVLIAGTALLSYQFLFNSKSDSNDVAVQPPVNNTEKKNDSGTVQIQTNNVRNQDSSTTQPFLAAEEKAVDTTQFKVSINRSTALANGSAAYKLTTDSAQFDVAFGSTPSVSGSITTDVPAKEGQRKEDLKALAEIKSIKADTTTLYNAGIDKTRQEFFKDKEADTQKSVVVSGDVAANAYGMMKKQPSAPVRQRASNSTEGFAYYRPNIFRGVVTDANNNPLPFANITNTRDNVGTYSDAHGLFTLASPSDSVLHVQVKVLGFENSNIQLRSISGDNLITMREDRSLATKILDTVKRDYAKRSREATMTLEEPEPEDGWDYYGSYLVNNLVIPDKFEMKKEGETVQNVVEVSFEVNRNGEPINIRVEKSLCEKCDKEAIRLIKAGPKWKSKAKRGKRTTVKVPFIKTE